MYERFLQPARVVAFRFVQIKSATVRSERRNVSLLKEGRDAIVSDLQLAFNTIFADSKKKKKNPR